MLEVVSLLIEPSPPVCVAANMDVDSSGLPIAAEYVDDPAVVSGHCHHDAWSGHQDMILALVDDLELTPNSITRISSKYSLDALRNLGHDPISPGGSSADDSEGRALEVFRVKFHRAIDVIAMHIVFDVAGVELLIRHWQSFAVDQDLYFEPSIWSWKSFAKLADTSQFLSLLQKCSGTAPEVGGSACLATSEVAPDAAVGSCSWVKGIYCKCPMLCGDLLL
ncbi:hypothetical protein Nepgr_021085 [Nepenthes gracilis]|uniref:Uncharacterized protein n=1 Tax=Nepenthes gracilis TaxID=150966 RepID=A0AAD3XWQ9_NEPGR|nr:hypothetical protein Nepgr_021085 [Nepenthes gracilis]